MILCEHLQKRYDYRWFFEVMKCLIYGKRRSIGTSLLLIEHLQLNVYRIGNTQNNAG